MEAITSHIEAEIKFQAPGPQALAQMPEILHDLKLAVHDSGHRILVDCYFDTADQAIRQSGWALRFRSGESSGGSMVRTLKALAPADRRGISKREEQEEIVAAPDSEWEGKALLETFQVFQDRWWWRAGNDRLEVEASYDFVQWRKTDAEREVVLCDDDFAIEIELKSGESSDLAAIATSFAAHTNWQPALWSKFSRGLEL